MECTDTKDTLRETPRGMHRYQRYAERERFEKCTDIKYTVREIPMEMYLRHGYGYQMYG